MTILRIAFEFVVLLISFFVPTFIVMQFPGHDALLDSPLLIALFTLSGAAQLFFMCGVVRMNGNFSLAELGITRPNKGLVRKLIEATIGICVLYAVLMIVISVLPPDLRDRVIEGYRWKLSHIGRMPLIIVFCIVVGYREEFLFRAYLLSFFERMKSPLPLSLAFSAVFFGALHSYEGIAAMIFAGGAGLFFSWMFVRHRDLHAIALAHGIFNAGLIFVSLFVPV